VDQLLSTTFDVPVPDDQLRQQVMERLEQTLSFLLDSTMNPSKSNRYVIGENKVGYSSVVAFSVRGDMKQQIFLSDKYFEVPPDYKANLASDSPFPVTLHFQASVLIHEVAHLACLADDFAYVYAQAPLLKAINNSSAPGERLCRQLLESRQAFRKKTPRNKLFKTTDPATGKQRDLAPSTDLGYDTLLEVGGVATLAEVRDLFRTDDDIRAKIILRNADSIAFLATRLGSERFPYDDE
jgi:hypothetical protein